MKLAKDQIQELYKFTTAHYVEYYDLQTELVDHLANGIERQWQQNPNLSFEEAKEREFKKFGVFGFMDVVAEGKKSMGSRYRAIVWGYFKEWWSLPKLIGTISAVSIIFIVIRSLPYGGFKLATIGGVFILLSLLMFYRSFQLKRNIKSIQRKWMLQELIYEQSVAVQLFFIPVHFLNLMDESSFLDTFYGQSGTAVIILVMLILLHILGYVIPSKAEELLAKTYPEYKFQEKV